MPEDFEERWHAALDLLDRAEEARARLLAEGGSGGDHAALGNAPRAVPGPSAPSAGFPPPSSHFPAKLPHSNHLNRIPS